ncbi:MAG: toprim domain-containing protein [Syntrophaceae bacterium]|nr:toprim domain-containing protein [Syntrophaceae bacterium]
MTPVETKPIMTSAIDGFKQAMSVAGVEPPAEIVADGELHRFTVPGDQAHSRNGWYIFHGDPPAAGAFGCWKRGISEMWCSKTSQSMTPAERSAYTAKMEAVKQKRKKELKRIQTECRIWCAEAWDKAEAASNEHDYLKRKGIYAYGLKSFNDTLLIPVQDMEGNFHGLQFIATDGTKKFKTGTSKVGHFFRIGEVKSNIVVLCEGYATGATIHEATGHAIFIAFDAGNLLAVAQIIRLNFPEMTIIVAADDDHGTEGNPGLTKATEAAEAVNGLLAVPVFPDNRGTRDSDFNDLNRLSGGDAVRSCINASKAMDMLHDEATKDDKKTTLTKTEKLIQLVLGKADLFHDADQKAFATVKSGNHRETYPLRSKGFKSWLSGRFWAEYKESIGAQIIQDALGTLEGHAIHDGSCYPVYVRLGVHNENIYLDLGNDQHEVVEITANGWSILENQNLIKFRRPSGMSALPYPKKGGSLDMLKGYVNLSNPADWPLIVGFILSCFHPVGPYPILAITGEQGSAKSTLLKVVKSITDPSTAPLRSAPKELRDLAISTNNSWCLAFDNLSDIAVWLSDGLCRLSTGGGFATRTLYSDDEETIFDTKRPVMLNCIDNVIRRHDLADRALIVDLAVISEDKRIPESEFWSDFKDDAPEILAAILDAVSCALHNVDHVKLKSYPRMADFAKWVTAAESVLGWQSEVFMTAYNSNRKNVTSLTLDADLVGTMVQKFMDSQTAWEGTASEMLDGLEIIADDRTKKAHSWPKAPHILSGRLKRSAPSLRAKGINVAFPGEGSRGKSGRLIVIERIDDGSVHKRLSNATDENNIGITEKEPSTLSRNVHTELDLRDKIAGQMDAVDASVPPAFQNYDLKDLSL